MNTSKEFPAGAQPASIAKFRPLPTVGGHQEFLADHLEEPPHDWAKRKYQFGFGEVASIFIPG